LLCPADASGVCKTAEITTEQLGLGLGLALLFSNGKGSGRASGFLLLIMLLVDQATTGELRKACKRSWLAWSDLVSRKHG
jgi:hypothetical protein